MDTKGKKLERLVALIEKLHLPEGVEIKTNERVYDKGIQIAEFDIEIRGQLGTKELRWLIECRDRPTEGPAPASWIEQLVGRRSRFGFNKVTAVSTTGFAKGALNFAKGQGIETCKVKALAPEHFADWLVMRTIIQIEKSGRLEHATFLIDENESPERQAAFHEIISMKGAGEEFLRWIETNKAYRAAAAFQAAILEKLGAYDEVAPGQPKPLTLIVSYPDDRAHFVVDTRVGPVRVRQIIFCGALTTARKEISLSGTMEYAHSGSGEPISQSASFEFEALGAKLSFEMHKLTGSSGETHIVLRKIEDHV
jgi:Restriction endonuclease